MRTSSKLSPCSDSIPSPPLPATMCRSMTSGTPLSLPDPAAWTEVAPSAAAFAAATMSSADFEDTPFEEVLFDAPQAVSIATLTTVQMTRSGRNNDDLLWESGQRHDRTERGGQRGRPASSVGKEPIV